MSDAGPLCWRTEGHNNTKITHYLYRLSGPRQGQGRLHQLTPAPAAAGATTSKLTGKTIGGGKGKLLTTKTWLQMCVSFRLTSDHQWPPVVPVRDCFVLHFIQTRNFNSNQDAEHETGSGFGKMRGSVKILRLDTLLNTGLLNIEPGCIELHQTTPRWGIKERAK